jgi:hypothetical protein
MASFVIRTAIPRGVVNPTPVLSESSELGGGILEEYMSERKLVRPWPWVVLFAKRFFNCVKVPYSVSDDISWDG